MRESKPFLTPQGKAARTTSQIGFLLRLLALLAVIGLSFYIYSIRDQVQDLEAFGYPGIFLVSLISNATVIIPVPGLVIASAMGAIFNPVWVALAAGSGAALGELSGYLAGFGGQAVINDTERYRRMTYWMKKYGNITILLLAFIPNPAFDLAGIIAGALKLNVLRFLFWCLIGKVLKMFLFAYFGAQVMAWLL